MQTIYFYYPSSYYCCYSFDRMAGPSSDQTNIAQKTWELSNCIETISTMDEIYRYDRKEQQDILTAKPWEKEYGREKE